MDIVLQKSIRNGIIVGGIMCIIVLFYGAIYNGFMSGALEVTLGNILLSLLGIMAAGIMYFIPSFFISLIFYYFKYKNKTVETI